MAEIVVHVAVHLEYYGKTCKKIVSNRIHEYEPVETFEELDEQMGKQNYTLAPFACPLCGKKRFPETIAFYNIASEDMRLMVRKKIGSPELPVVDGENTPYGVVVSREDQAEYERGLAKTSGNFKEHEQEFWQGYFAFADKKWHEILKEINEAEYVEGYKRLKLPFLPQSASVHSWRKDAEKRFQTEEEKRAFWQAVNRYLVNDEFVWTPIDTWPIDSWLKKYGRERVTYITLQLPLREEFEKYRTEKLSQIIRKKSGETGILFERIGQLRRELEKQKKRAFKLAWAGDP